MQSTEPVLRHDHLRCLGGHQVYLRLQAWAAGDQDPELLRRVAAHNVVAPGTHCGAYEGVDFGSDGTQLFSPTHRPRRRRLAGELKPTVQRKATSCTVASSNINDLAIPQLDWSSALLDVVLAGVRRRGAILQSHGFGWLGAQILPRSSYVRHAGGRARR